MTYALPANLPALHNALIHWFETNRVDLPWRMKRDPYSVWLSEIMLQQTQVATVIPYYERFLARFPTVKDLAGAPLDDVLKLWEGLGYYSRARNLHRAAGQIVEMWGGTLPSTVDKLLTLPGIGRYTAGAVASLAFGQDTAVLDGNVIRIFTRLFDITDDVSQSSTQASLWALTQDCLPAGQAALWNEGLMELGRLVCTPKSPLCDACPLTAWCTARRAGTHLDRPVKRPKPKTPHFDVTAAVIKRADGQFLIAQRRPEGMLGGLWEFPGGKREPGETLADCLQREIREELGITIVVNDQIGVVRHAYTHLRITLYAYHCTLIRGEPRAIECADWTWVTLDDLDRYAFPVTDQKIIAMLRAGGGQLGMDLI